MTVKQKRKEDHSSDEKSRTFTPWSHVAALVYAQLTHAIGLNDVCDALRGLVAEKAVKGKL